MLAVLLLLALLGHAFLWVTSINRLHASRVEGGWREAATLLAFAAMFSIPLVYAALLFQTGWRLSDAAGQILLPWPAIVYLGFCWMGALAMVVSWVKRHFFDRHPEVLRYHRTRIIEVPRHDDEHHFLVRLPGNEILQLDVAERGVDVPRLAPALDRLSIVHLSDFHFTGRIGQSFFREVVRRTNDFQADLILITGDLVDDPAYIDWIPETLGQLKGRYGTYFVLGNHDRRADHQRLRRVLADSGLIDLGGQYREIEIRGEPVVLAGNELPWFCPAADLSQLPDGEYRPLCIALAHSPDQLPWAQAHGVDLLLAGHTHGGQIRLPLLGPVFSPCRHGVKYAWGLYHAPPTILHVTRGVSGEFPVRMNCAPEIVRLVLHVPG